MKKKRIGVLLALMMVGFSGAGAISASAEEVIWMRPTIQGTNITDYRKPGIMIKDGKAYSTVPGTKNIRDYRRPAYKIERGEDGLAY